MKNNDIPFFKNTSLLFSMINPDDPDFNYDLISDCIKETHPQILLRGSVHRFHQSS